MNETVAPTKRAGAMPALFVFTSASASRVEASCLTEPDPGNYAVTAMSSMALNLPGSVSVMHFLLVMWYSNSSRNFSM